MKLLKVHLLDIFPRFMKLSKPNLEGSKKTSEQTITNLPTPLFDNKIHNKLCMNVPKRVAVKYFPTLKKAVKTKGMKKQNF